MVLFQESEIKATRKFYISPYIVNHMTCIALFSKQESLELSKESPESRFQMIPDHVNINL